jgi:hypothetical protein
LKVPSESSHQAQILGEYSSRAGRSPACIKIRDVIEAKLEIGDEPVGPEREDHPALPHICSPQRRRRAHSDASAAFGISS